jgi:hypothetical protein
MLLAAVGGGCGGDTSPAGGSSTGGSGGPVAGAGGAGGSGAGGRGGSVGGSGGGAVVPDASAGTPSDAASGTAPDADITTPDASSGTTSDAPAGAVDATSSSDDGGITPMGSDGGPQPSYEGEIPIYYGPEVGPTVQMNCPGDPTEGFTEYKDSFHLERPYNVPANTRFSIIGGIYNFWVFPNDRPHSPIAMGRNPRTEATYGGTHDKANVSGGSGVSGRIGYFTTGQRLYSADMLIETNAIGSAIMQIHTTASGGGPIGLRMQANGNLVNNGSLTVVQGSSVPGGLVNRWFNFKASLDTASLEVKIYINNCLKSTYRGDRGDGRFYFKNGVYFCKTSQNGCFSHYKNVHLYKK